MEKAAAEHSETINKVRELVKGIDIAMLTTVSEQGLVSRPMKTQDMDSEGNLWFFTKKDTGKFHELLQNKQVNISYSDKSFVSIRGEAELVDNNEKKKELWSKGYEILLETTYDDPNLVLIKVNAETAEYWDSGNKFKMVSFIFNKFLGKNTSNSHINETAVLK